MLALIGDPTSLVSSFGYVAIFLLCVAQSCCIPTSSELTMGFAGALAATGHMSLPAAIGIGAGGELIGAYLAWMIGRTAGRAVVDRFGKYVLLTHHDLDRAEAWYDRHGRWGVFGGRLVPVIRNFVALPAGVAEVPLVRFGVLTLAGSLIWDGAMAGIGYGVGSRWHAIVHAFSDAGYVLGALAVVAIVLLAVHRWRSYGAQMAASRAAATSGVADEVSGSAGATGGTIGIDGLATVTTPVRLVEPSPPAELSNPREELVTLIRRLAAPGDGPGERHGAAANERLTAAAAAVLFVLLFFEGLTLVRIGSMMAFHVILGLILVPPLVVKLASTGWRFVRYYSGHPGFVRKGPPQMLLRALAPVLVLSSLVLFASGIALVAVHRPYGWLDVVHRYDFLLWFAVLAVHVLFYMWQVPGLLRRDLSRRRRYRSASPRGRRLRPAVALGSVVVGVVLAVTLWPLVSAQTHTFFRAHTNPGHTAHAQATGQAARGGAG